MCGIFFYQGNLYNLKSLHRFFVRLKHRGPDHYCLKKVSDVNILGFHRLAINGLDMTGNQPLELDGIYLLANAEIYNYKDLIQRYHLHEEYNSTSDCYIILLLYKKLGIEKLCRLIDGEFAFVIYDDNLKQVFICRDALGIRSLFWSNTDDLFFVASEMKAIPEEITNVNQFPPGCYYLKGQVIPFFSLETQISDIRNVFERACKKRLMSERSIGCILSGGLDSTITTLVVSKLAEKKINTYTIGLEGATDLYYARLASKYIGTNHYEFVISEQEFLDFIPETIHQIESYDVTTVRASVGNYLLAKKIKQLDIDVVLFCGDVSDELFGSYRGFQNAPSEIEFSVENKKMLQNIHFFDVLRSDKCISGASLEARVPFGDPEFVNCVMSLDPKLKMFSKDRIEKYIFRRAFDGMLPDELLYRRKEAFSDGVSTIERSWHQIIKEHMDQKISNEYFTINAHKFTHNHPYHKESLYYREIFEKYYPNRAHTIPYFWKHPFTQENDPSARKLENY
jgi:asparagine synthase (glutamine-hydrolysing)